MSLRRTQGHTITAKPPEATGCTACGHAEDVLIPIPLAGFSDSPGLVCVDPGLCRRRATTAGIYGGGEIR